MFIIFICVNTIIHLADIITFFADMIFFKDAMCKGKVSCIKNCTAIFGRVIIEITVVTVTETLIKYCTAKAAI